jgi:hypothetical protein
MIKKIDKSACLNNILACRMTLCADSEAGAFEVVIVAYIVKITLSNSVSLITKPKGAVHASSHEIEVRIITMGKRLT